MFLSVVVLAASATVPTQCPLDSATQARLKASCITYTTVIGDTPYSLAEKFYGKGWQSYKISEPNKQFLDAKGFFKPGSKILIPPLDNGRPVDAARLDERRP